MKYGQIFKSVATCFCRLTWPRDLCYVRYWRRNDDGSYGKFFADLLIIELYVYFSSFRNLFIFLSCFGSCAVVLFRSREHENCGPQPGYVRAHVESKLYVNSLFLLTLERRVLNL